MPRLHHRTVDEQSLGLKCETLRFGKTTCRYCDALSNFMLSCRALLISINTTNNYMANLLKQLERHICISVFLILRSRILN